MKKPIVILSVAAALAALAAPTAATASTGQPSQQNDLPTDDAKTTTKTEPNLLYKAGGDILGLIVTQQPDGTIIAQHSSHYSHSSHSSHSSHHSHYSSRY